MIRLSMKILAKNRSYQPYLGATACICTPVSGQAEEGVPANPCAALQDLLQVPGQPEEQECFNDQYDEDHSQTCKMQNSDQLLQKGLRGFHRCLRY